MARPRQSIFDEEEEKQLIIPMTEFGIRMVTRNGEVTAVTSEFSNIRSLSLAERVVNELSHMDSEPYYEVRHDHGRSIFYRVVPSQLMKQMSKAWNGMSQIVSMVESGSERSVPKVRIASRLNVFQQAYSELLTKYGSRIAKKDGFLLEKASFEDFSKLSKETFAGFKEALESPVVRKESKQAQTRMYRNRQSLFAYVDSLLTHYSKLYVVRVDLGYNPDSARVPQKVTYSRAKRDFEKLMAHRHRKRMWKDDLVGFIWKLEDGAERRYHYHLLLFYDGERAEQHKEDQKLIHEQWINDLTEGDGACFISWEKAEETPLGVSPDGLIDREDHAKRKAILVYLDYLTRIDRLIGLEVPDNARVFGKGQLPKS
ncbi:YagK/YfjJ domain-containing protein [Modicisalibacter xianhensis]|uniref:YagK/YfjJ C-terminal domain-containing protein n=1 Tax=Modicisalibacter xianhensis TaxID=442341 RepID=A0A1I2ZL35_9GAMM|nr:inovirus-type Gp2 protein [Halomonas xianhensis]SFH38430.1 Protein of unknown function [Halomonas xianhensis]